MSDGPRRIVVGSDEATTVCRSVLAHLRDRGLEVTPVGPLAALSRPLASGRLGDDTGTWVSVAARVGSAVAGGAADVGVLLCYTGTGVCMAANKVAGVRAALCTDAATAAGSRRWNDANVVVLSYRLASNTVAREILDAFLSTPPDPAEDAVLAELAELDRGRWTP